MATALTRVLVSATAGSPIRLSETLAAANDLTAAG